MKIKTMKSKIRKPVLILIITVPLITLILFNIFIHIYTNQIAKKELQVMSKTMETVVKREISGDLSNISALKLNNAFVKLYRAMNSSKLAANTEILLYNKHQELLYPNDLTDSFLNQSIIDKVSNQISEIKEHKVYTIYVKGEKYYLLCYPLVNIDGDQPTIVFISQTGEANALINAMNLILLIIMVIGSIMASLIASYVSSHVSKPITDLTNLTKRIGGGDFTPVRETISSDILEINQLYKSIGDMTDRLSRYDETQKTFLQNASHELKTPLMSIQGYAEGIEKGIVPNVTHAAEIISNESKRLNSLVEQLLTLSRIENGTYSKEFNLMNLSDVLKEYAQRLAGYTTKIEHQLVLDLPNFQINVMADDTLLSQSVMNIVSNCLRYANSIVKITLLTSNNYAVIRICDDGDGIPENDLPHIFDRFYKGKGGNFGLGLAIAKSAAVSIGGYLNAYNNDFGAVFEIFLPMQKS